MSDFQSGHEKAVTLPRAVWVLLADMERARLLCCRRMENDHLHVETCATIENDLPERAHLRSPPMWKNTTVTYDIGDEDTYEREKRFVHDVTAWMSKKIEQHGIGNLALLTPPRFSGLFRKTKFARQFGVKVIQHRGELINLPVRKLAHHTIIRQLMA